MRDPRTARRPSGPGNRWELVWSHRDELLEIARSRSASAEEAEDAVQEAMIRAVEDPGVQYGRVRAWLRRATLRACAERHRQVAREAELSRSLHAAPVEPLLVEEVACDRAEARWLAARSEELLPARQAEALRLHSQELDVGQVARAMGLSYRATESLLARARRALRHALAGGLTLALTLWPAVRRFPRTGVSRQAVAATAAATAAVVGVALPAGPSLRAEARPPADRPERAAPRAVDPPAPRGPAERSRAASPSPDPGDRKGQDTSRPVTEEPAERGEPRSAAAVRISIGAGTHSSVLPSTAVRVSIAELPGKATVADVPENSAPPVGISVEGLTVPVDPRRTDRQGILPR
ncbi:sigma-70 family RNA polymerase sigma factor [Streptomyces sp. ALB3]|uniref:sigma-70 family RNA polymerase sigma factor n=1 Tax=Streptomyces sp. ALB3 TaxID=3374278 RepID=UPI00378BDCC0